MSVANALASLRPGAAWTLRGNSYDGLEWVDANQTKPTEQEVLDEIARLEALEASETAKTQAYEGDTQRKSFWDNVDTMTKDEFVTFVDGFVTNQATAKTAIIRLALEVGRLRRRVG